MASLSSDQIAALRSKNKMIYDRKPDYGIINDRSEQAYNFSNSTYSQGQSMQIQLPVGARAVWGRGCYLRMSVEGDAACTLSALAGSGYNFIKSFRLTHRSGVQLEYINNVDTLASSLIKYRQTRDEYRSSLGMMGGSITAIEAAPGARSYAAGTPIAFCLPLSFMSGFFDGDDFIPPGALAGANIEIVLQTGDIGLIASAGVLAVTSVQLVMDTAVVMDSAVKQILEEETDSANSGIQYTFSTWFNTEAALTGTGTVSLNVQRSASVAQMLLAAAKLDSNLVAANDSSMFVKAFTGIRVRVGSNYTPDQPTTSDAQIYAEALKAFNAFPAAGRQNDKSKRSSVAVDYALFVNSTDASIVAIDLTKVASGLGENGDIVNGSRPLLLEATDVSGAASTAYLFLKSLNVANFMGENVVLDV